MHKPCALGETINEDSPLAPKWPYPESKVEAEKIIANHHGKIPYLILRLAGLYDDGTCVPTLANQIARSYERDIKSYLYAGDLKAGQSFIHHDDLMNIFKKALLHRNELEEEEIILVGEPKAVSYEKLQSLISQLIHDEKSTLYKVPAPIAKAGAWLEHQAEPLIPDDFDQGEKPFVRSFMIDLASDNYALDVSKADKVLNWEPQHTIEKTLPKIIKTLKSYPEHCIMIILLGVISITFIVIQPIFLNTWCTLCLIAAIAMLLQVPYSFDELVATSTFLWRRWKAGRPILRVLFVGDSDEMTRSKNEAYLLNNHLE